MPKQKEKKPSLLEEKEEENSVFWIWFGRAYIGFNLSIVAIFLGVMLYYAIPVILVYLTPFVIAFGIMWLYVKIRDS